MRLGQLAITFVLAAPPLLMGCLEGARGDHRGGPPHFDVRHTCRAEAAESPTTEQSCMKDEQRAQEQLAREWAEFAAADRTTCVSSATDLTGVRSYVELLTCLELARDAGKLPKEAKE
jgi:hypothetical protein